MSAAPTPPDLSSPPTPPQRSDSANFSARADVFLSWLAGVLVSDVSAALAWMRDALADVLTAKNAAATSATQASGSATSAANSASTASSQANSASVSATGAASSAAAAAMSEASAGTQAGQASVSAVSAATSEASAATSAANAATSANQAAASAANAGFANVTSSSSVAIGTGNKVFSVNAVRAYAPSMPVRVVHSAQVYMQGTISAINGNDITVNVTQVTGAAGSYGAWTFAPDGTDASVVRLTGAQTLSEKTLTGLREVNVALGSDSAIDLATGNGFSKTIMQATSFTLTNVAAGGTLNSFLLDLTNGGSSTITWWPGIKWPGGIAPVLTASGRDVLGFFSADGGTTWTGFVAKDVR